jgi:hypothetical protein
MTTNSAEYSILDIFELPWACDVFSDILQPIEFGIIRLVAKKFTLNTRLRDKTRGANIVDKFIEELWRPSRGPCVNATVFCRWLLPARSWLKQCADNSEQYEPAKITNIGMINIFIYKILFSGAIPSLIMDNKILMEHARYAFSKLQKIYKVNLRLSPGLWAYVRYHQMAFDDPKLQFGDSITFLVDAEFVVRQLTSSKSTHTNKRTLIHLIDMRRLFGLFSLNDIKVVHDVCKDVFISEYFQTYQTGLKESMLQLMPTGVLFIHYIDICREWGLIDNIKKYFIENREAYLKIINMSRGSYIYHIGAPTSLTCSRRLNVNFHSRLMNRYRVAGLLDLAINKPTGST